jgi:hypothetical protein
LDGLAEYLAFTTLFSVAFALGESYLQKEAV